MTQLNYIGPEPKLLTGPKRGVAWRKLPIAFFLVVVLPTALTALYYLLIASPIYVSEARFVVRSPQRPQVSGIGVALQSVGLSAATSESFAVHEYITSRDSLRDLQRTVNVAAVIGPKDADVIARYPAFGESKSEEGLYKGFQRFVTVGYDSSTGISTLRVEAFKAADAHRLASGLLTGGENLINRLNERAQNDALSAAARAETDARTKLANIQEQLAQYRNSQGFIDPEQAARESSQLIGTLLANIGTLRADADQLQAEAPQSPQLPILRGRIAAFEGQVAAERAKLTGNSSSLAPRVGRYEDLVLARELADKEVTQAAASVTSSQQEARRQNLYLERIVAPNLPDKATRPRRWFGILTVLMCTLLIYAIGWLVYAGIREHSQD